MKEVTTARMKELEHAADAAGLSYLQMMENAGAAAVQLLVQRMPALKSVFVFCGKGNNGGDGFVAARLLKEKGVKAAAVLTEGVPVTADALANYARAEKCGVRMLSADALTDAEKAEIRNADAVIDAVYGTGFHGALRPEGAKAAALINTGRFVYALDLPSGIGADTGEIAEGAVRAALTITFHAPKACHRIACAQCGETVTADIGITAALSGAKEAAE